jgi:WD40 repeat protein
VKTLAFDALGTQLLAITEGDTATVWDLRTGSRKDLPREAKAWRAWFSHDGQQVLVSGGRVWKLADLTSVSLDTTSSLNSATFSPDDQRIVAGTGEYPIEGDGSARVFDAATGRALTPPLPHGEDVTCTAFSANGQWVATGSRDGTARIWNAGTGLPETPPLRHLGAVTSVQFAEAKGKHLLLSASDDGTVRLWKFGEQKEARALAPGLQLWEGCIISGWENQHFHAFGLFEHRHFQPRRSLAAQCTNRPGDSLGSIEAASNGTAGNGNSQVRRL